MVRCCLPSLEILAASMSAPKPSQKVRTRVRAPDSPAPISPFECSDRCRKSSILQLLARVPIRLTFGTVLAQVREWSVLHITEFPSQAAVTHLDLMAACAQDQGRNLLQFFASKGEAQVFRSLAQRQGGAGVRRLALIQALKRPCEQELDFCHTAPAKCFELWSGMPLLFVGALAAANCLPGDPHKTNQASWQ